VTSQKKVREFLRHYNRERQVVTMLTSHYMQDIEELCRRVIIIDGGRIFYDGPLEAIIDRFATHKILDLTFAAESACAFADFGEVLEQSAQTVRIKVPRANVSDTCRALLTSCTVTDISVQEPPVEEVIRQLFSAQAETTAAAAQA
jgi:ABC-2 type transport system ATP-binding protein